MSARVCVQMGCTADACIADVEAVKQETHDMVICQAGEFRSGPVGWTIVGGKKALGVLEKAATSIDDVDGQQIVQALIVWLKLHPKGQLVIASCNLRDGAPV